MTDAHDLSAQVIDRPQSYADMLDRKAFVAPLDHQQHHLKAVLTDYHFAQLAPCGLKGCRQPHNNGFLVITESGVETNVGKDCGRSYFGDAVFSTAQADYQRRRQRADLISRIRALQAEADPIAARLKDVVFRKFGGKWTRRVEGAIVQLLGQPLVDSLGFAHLRGELAVLRTVERSDEEIDDAVAMTPGLSRERAKYVTETVGTLEPMPWIGFDFRQRLLGNLVEPLRALALVDPDELPTPKLKAKLKPFDDLDAEIARAEEAAASAIRFLSPDHLNLIAHWLPPHYRDSANALRAWAGTAQHTALLTGEPG